MTDKETLLDKLRKALKFEVANRGRLNKVNELKDQIRKLENAGN